MKTKIAIVILFFVVLFLGVYFFIDFDTNKTKSQLKTSFSLSDSQVLYQKNCASCHGDNLEGEANWQVRKTDGALPAPPHNESGHTWHHSDLFLFEYTKFGGKKYAQSLGMQDWKSGMPAFEDILSDDEIQSILSYIKSTWPKKIQDAQKRRSSSQ